MGVPLIVPNWPAPPRVQACSTTRLGGVSLPPFDSFNLGTHVGDSPRSVMLNRARLQAQLGCQPVWLRQVHSTRVVSADPTLLQEADASWTTQSQVACCVLTADCLPVLFCNRAGTRVAAAHAGWRGLLGGVLEESWRALACSGEETLVWLGPAIGPMAYEVGPEVRAAFMAVNTQAKDAFRPVPQSDRYWADLYLLARQRLAQVGVKQVFGGAFCTLTEARFFSYRREAQTGRQASLIWLSD